MLCGGYVQYIQSFLYYCIALIRIFERYLNSNTEIFPIISQTEPPATGLSRRLSAHVEYTVLTFLHKIKISNQTVDILGDQSSSFLFKCYFLLVMPFVIRHLQPFIAKSAFTFNHHKVSCSFLFLNQFCIVEVPNSKQCELS